MYTVYISYTARSTRLHTDNNPTKGITYKLTSSVVCSLVYTYICNIAATSFIYTSSLSLFMQNYIASSILNHQPPSVIYIYIFIYEYIILYIYIYNNRICVYLYIYKVRAYRHHQVGRKAKGSFALRHASVRLFGTSSADEASSAAWRIVSHRPVSSVCTVYVQKAITVRAQYMHPYIYTTYIRIYRAI